MTTHTPAPEHPAPAGGPPRPPADLWAELRSIDAQLDWLFARRAFVTHQLQSLAGPPSGPYGGPGPAMAPGAPARPGSGVQQLLLITGAGLLGLAGLFFAAVAFSLVGGVGRTVILVLIAALLGGLAVAVRSRLRGAAESLAAVAATLLATAAYAGPLLWGVEWSGTAYAGWCAASSALLATALAGAHAATRLTAWAVAATGAAALAVVATATTVGSATADVIGYSATPMLLVLLVAAAGHALPVHRAGARAAWATVIVAGLAFGQVWLLGWLLESERTATYAALLLGWALVLAVLPAVVPVAVRSPRVASVARTAAAVHVAAAIALVVGGLGWGSPNLALTGLAALLVVAVAHLRALPLAPTVAAAVVLGLGSVLVPEVTGEPGSGRGAWIALLVVVAVALAVAGLTPRPGADTYARGLLWAGAGVAASLAWIVQLSDPVIDGPVEQASLPIGAILLLAGAGWAVSVRRTGARWRPTAAPLLPGLLVAGLPGALASMSLTWSDGWSTDLTRTIVYTVVGAVAVVLGARLRVAALLVAGEVVIGICVLAHLWAVTQVIDQWIVMAATGALLLAVGARWEWLRTHGTRALGWAGRLR